MEISTLTQSPSWAESKNWAESKKGLIFKHLHKPVVYQTSFWLLYFFLNTMRWGSYFDDYGYSFKSNLVEFPIHIILVYFNLYFLLPKLMAINLGRYILMLFLSVLAMSMLRIILTYEFVTTDIWRESTLKEDSLFGLNYIMAVFIGELYVVGITTAIKLGTDWLKTIKVNRELERRNHQTELSYLRSQVQPHFFFNTLNNLYSLSLDKSDKAPETILKLSELMSYVIYNGDKRQIKLMEEIRHIQNYIDLEQLRYGDKLNVTLELEGNMEKTNVPPLILIPFVENSFKHGIQLQNGQVPLKIKLAVSQEHLFFTIWNLKSAQQKEVNQPDVFHNGGGVGIQNTRRRLELIYGDDYDLQIENKDDSFNVSLKVKLDEN